MAPDPAHPAAAHPDPLGVGGPRSEGTRRTILDAARGLFAARGYEQTTIRAVAAQAGIDASMVMRYFGSKAGLFAAAATIDLDPPDLASASPRRRGEVLVGHFVARWERNPTEDMLSVLVFAEIDGDKLTDDEIFAGFLLLMIAGNDSTKATYTSTMRALMENPDQRRLLIDDLSLVPGAIEEALRMYPAFAHFRRTATKDTELGGCPIKKGDKLALWYPSSNRDEDRYTDPDRFDVLRNPEHQAFGAGGRHFCLGTALARLELKVLVEETVKRFPNMAIDGEPTWVLSQFSSQLKSLPVHLHA